jgi:hypothetical protein
LAGKAANERGAAMIRGQLRKNTAARVTRMKWKEQLNGDCPKRDAHSLHERCDLICPDLSKIL